MGRAPIDRSAAGRDELWAAIRKLAGVRFTAADLVARTGANVKTVRDYCRALTASGHLEQQVAETGRAKIWILKRDVGVEAPRVRLDGSAVQQGNATEQLWRGMFMLKEFSFVDLIETASVPIPAETAKAYCKMLLATGYLRVLTKADPVKGRVARYRLIRNNGPKPPQIQRVKQVYDPNTRQVFRPEGAV